MQIEGEEDTVIHLYALWAPITNYITYVDSLDNAAETYTPDSYIISENPNNITIEQPIEGGSLYNSGYRVVGWYIYQNEEKMPTGVLQMKTNMILNICQALQM